MAGAPFPELYDWTWGEIVEFIVCYNERQKLENRQLAMMNFKMASLISSMIVGKKGQTHNVVDAFDHLWTEEERAEIHAQIDEQRMVEYFMRNMETE